MKEWRTLILCFGLAGGLAACGSSSHSTASPATASSSTAVVASTTTTIERAHDATGVATAMIHAGVPATLAFTYTAENDPNHLLGRQGGYLSKVSLQDHGFPQITDFINGTSTDGGAAIECYSDSSGANQRYNYLKAFGGGPIGDGYDYVSGKCVLRLDKKLTPTQAAQYQQAFEAAST